MRFDVTQKPVGTFFGGRRGHETSVVCPVCAKPGLLVKTTRRGTRLTRHIAHGFELKLNPKNEPECQWDKPCAEGGMKA